MELPPELVIIPRCGHAAGVAVEGIGGVHGVAHGVDGFVKLRALLKRRRFDLGTQQSGNVEAACHHQNSTKLSRSLPDAPGHMGLPGQTPVLHQLHLRRILPGEEAVGIHQMYKLFIGKGQALHLEIFFPEFLKAAQPGLFTKPLLEAVMGQVAVRGIAELLRIGAKSPGLFGGEQDFSKAQIDEPSGNTQISGCLEGRQLRRGVEKGIIAPVKPRLVAVTEIVPLIPAGIVKCHRGHGFRIREELHQVIGILRSLHQDAVRSITPDHPLQMPGTNRAVVADGIVNDGSVQIKGNHFRRLLAS